MRKWSGIPKEEAGQPTKKPAAAISLDQILLRCGKANRGIPASVLEESALRASGFVPEQKAKIPEKITAATQDDGTIEDPFADVGRPTPGPIVLGAEEKKRLDQQLFIASEQGDLDAIRQVLSEAGVDDWMIDRFLGPPRQYGTPEERQRRNQEYFDERRRLVRELAALKKENTVHFFDGFRNIAHHAGDSQADKLRRLHVAQVEVFESVRVGTEVIGHEKKIVKWVEGPGSYSHSTQSSTRTSVPKIGNVPVYGDKIIRKSKGWTIDLVDDAHKK